MLTTDSKWSAEKSAHFYQITRRQIPEDNNIYSYPCENPWSHITSLVSIKLAVVNEEMIPWAA